MKFLRRFTQFTLKASSYGCRKKFLRSLHFFKAISTRSRFSLLKAFENWRIFHLNFFIISQSDFLLPNKFYVTFARSNFLQNSCPDATLKLINSDTFIPTHSFACLLEFLAFVLDIKRALGLGDGINVQIKDKNTFFLLMNLMKFNTKKEKLFPAYSTSFLFWWE